MLQFIRHASHPEYTPEPDLCHELLGHVPMLTDPAFSDMVFHIGLASLAADESQIWHLSKLFWYTVEFGCVREGGDIKAFGAGEPPCLPLRPAAGPDRVTGSLMTFKMSSACVLCCRVDSSGGTAAVRVPMHLQIFGPCFVPTECEAPAAPASYCT